MSRVSGSVVVIAAVATLLAACGSGKQGGGQQGHVPDVGVVTIEPQRAVLTAELPGRTSPLAVSDVRPQVSGILKARLFTEGSVVQAGQPLYQIDETLYAAALDSAKAQLASAKAALVTARLKAERYTALRKDKMISQQDNDDAQAALQQAEAAIQQQEANVETARVNLGYTKITAPITGKISRSFLTQGALVTANQAQTLATIQTLDPIYVDMNQSSSELLRLRQALAASQGAGQSVDSAAVTLALEDDTRYPLEGVLKFREVAVDPTTGSLTLRAQFPNPDGVLLPGMFVRATIVEGVEPAALLVPQRGVSRDEKGNATALIVDSDGVVQRRMLAVTQTVGSNWLVKNGIEPGDRVIVEGLQYARAGEKANAVAFTGRDAPKTAPATAAK
ncbi:MAG TPA: efflux RND transporter periplasmic adaptor subunit [Pseudomonadales bacterium]|nr:efflux RND transporter periplasmic adaptor subunit [Pseudomonadales bacterium]